MNSSINKVFTLLQSNAEKNNGTIKWSEYSNKFDNRQPILDYFSGQRGMAGIGQSLVALYNVTNNQTVKEMVLEIGNYFRENAVKEGYSIKWKREEIENTYWTSYRYGNAGILPFLLNLFELSRDFDYLTMAEQSGNWLIENAFSNTTDRVYWRITGQKGFSTNDYYYGSAGIVDSLLQLYSKTKNQTFLEYAINGANFIVSTKIVTNKTNGAYYVPWTSSNISSFKGIVYSGLYNGMAGIGEVLLHLYRQTKDIQWLTEAKQVGFWLQSKDFNDTGLFPNGGAPYLTRLNEGASNILGYSYGSLGVAEYYLHLFLQTKDIEWLYEIIRITSTVDTIISNENINNLLPAQKDNSLYYFGLQLGVAGLLKVYSELIEYFNEQSHIKTINIALHSIIDQLSNKGNITEIFGDPIINNNRENGLAGILEALSYVKRLEQTALGIEKNTYNRAIISLPEPEITFEKTASFNFTYSLLLIVVVAFIRLKHKRKRN